MNNRLINTKVAGGGGGCTDIVDNYDPFGGNGVALYQLNGDATDSSPNAYNGTFTNPAYGTGVFGQAAIMNSGYITVPCTATTPIDFSSENFAISLWINLDQIAGEVICSKWSTGAQAQRAIFLHIESDGRFAAYESDTSNTSTVVYSTATFSTGQWYHLVYSRNPTTAFIYINGQLDSQHTRSNNIKDASTQNFYFGRVEGSGGNDYKGDIDQVRIFDTILTPLEVEALYTEELCICDGTVDTLQVLGDTSCIATYQLDGNANDLSGNYSGTPTDVSYEVGEFDLAGVFNGSSSWIDLSDNSFKLSTITVSAWFNSASTQNLQNIYSCYDYQGQSRGFNIRLQDNNLILFQTYKSNVNSSLFSSSQIQRNTWNHVAVVATQSSVSIYINGSLDNSGSIVGFDYFTTHPFSIGRAAGEAEHYFDGSIDQVRIFNEALDGDDVAILFAESACTYTPKDYITENLALDFFSKDIDASATTWTDRANSNVLTKSGSTVYNNATGLVDFTGGYWGNDSLSETLKDASGDYTVEFFGQLDNSAQYIIAGIVQSPTVRGLLFTDTTTTIDGYNYRTGTNSNAQGINYPFQSGLNHIIIQFDNSAFQKFYLNGVLVKTTTNNLNSPFWTAPNGMRLGSDRTLPSLSSSMNMGIFRVYKGLLSEQDIITNYNWAIRQF